ncbi:MAG: hypothetical protein WD404_02055 [Solirubrobacterales bacterium]
MGAIEDQKAKEAERKAQQEAERAVIGYVGRAALVLVVGVLGFAAVAQAATVSKSDFSARVTAAVKPTKLPQARGAPVTLSIAGSSSRSEAATTFFRSYAVRLDRQLTIDTEGLPACSLPIKVLERAMPDYVRDECSRTVIGTGKLAVTLELPEQPPNFARSRMLFLNGRGGKVVMYRYFPRHKVHFENGEVEEVGDIPGGAFAIGSGRSLAFPSPEASQFPGSKSSFEFRFGRTWRYRGKRHSYLNAVCRTGTLRNRVTLGLSDGTVSNVSAQRCTKRS